MENEEIKTRKDFVSFVYGLREDFCKNPESWPNDTLGTFLEALAAWIEDIEGYYLNKGQPVPEKPDWQMIADMLFAARIYE